MRRHTFSGLAALLAGFVGAPVASAGFIGVPWITTDTPLLFQSTTIINAPMAFGNIAFKVGVHWDVVLAETNADADAFVDDLEVSFTHITAPHPEAGDVAESGINTGNVIDTLALITGPRFAAGADFGPFIHPAGHFDDLTIRFDPWGVTAWKISVQISHITSEGFIPPAIPEGGFDHIIPSPNAGAAMAALILGTMSRRRRVS